MLKRRAVLLLVTVGALAAPLAHGEQPLSKRTPGCEGAAHRQFDFWIGEWTVMAAGKHAGENRIERILDGCALLENWSGAGGFAGKSLNFYDAGRGRWHQTWIDHQGQSLALDGGIVDGSMVLSGAQPDPATKAVTTHRITWTPLPSGQVRQLWEAATDGRTWTVQFDGLYTRKP